MNLLLLFCPEAGNSILHNVGTAATYVTTDHSTTLDDRKTVEFHMSATRL
jgi:hypothetical protein